MAKGPSIPATGRVRDETGAKKEGNETPRRMEYSRIFAIFRQDFRIVASVAKILDLW